MGYQFFSSSLLLQNVKKIYMIILVVMAKARRQVPSPSPKVSKDPPPRGGYAAFSLSPSSGHRSVTGLPMALAISFRPFLVFSLLLSMSEIQASDLPSDLATSRAFRPEKTKRAFAVLSRLSSLDGSIKTL